MRGQWKKILSDLYWLAIKLESRLAEHSTAEQCFQWFVDNILTVCRKRFGVVSKFLDVFRNVPALVSIVGTVSVMFRNVGNILVACRQYFVRMYAAY